MPYAIRLPNGALVQNIPDDLSQEEAKQRIIAAGLVADQTIDQPQAPEGGFFPAIKRGALQTGMLAFDILPAMVARGFGADEYADRQLKEAAETQARIQREVPAAVPSFTDISSVGDAWMYAKEAVGESLVSLIPSLITGGAAGLLARPAVAAANQAAKEAAERTLMSAAMKAGPPTQAAIEKAKKEAVDAGIKAAQRTALKYEAVGGFAGSAAQNIPEVYQNILEETGKESIPAALIAGGFNAALDSILPISLLAKMRKQGLDPTEVVGAWYKRGAQGLGKGFLIEGATESAQEASSIAAENFVGENKEFFTPKNLERVINAGIKGGLGGGVITGVSDIALGKGPEPQESDRETAERLQREILSEVETARAEQLLAEQEAAEKARLEALRPPTDDEIVDLARAENGYGRLESVKQRLLNQEKTPEVVEALKTIRELQNRIVIEEQQRRAPSIPAEMTDEVIRKALGFAKSENPKSVYQQLIGKSTSDPDVLAFLRNYADTKAAPQTKLRIEGFLERAGQTPLTAQEIAQGERDAGQAIVAPGGAGVAVAGEPGAGAAAPGVGITQPSGVVPPVEDVEQPDVREGTEQPSVGQIISIPLTDRDAVEQHAVKGYPIIEAPLDQLSISMDVPQFKSDADKRGIVKPLEGKFERIGVAPIQLWRRLDGRLEVISGRHRFDLAQRTGETTIPAQIHDEASGFGAAQAATLDAELNIRDEQGEVKDYVVYFENSGISEADAKSRGLLGRTVGQRGWAIASKGSPELVAAHRSGVVPDDAAAGIATLAPNDSRIQAVGLRAVQDNKSTPAVLNTVQAVQALATERGAPREEAGDLFGFDDSAIKEAEEMARIATDRQRSITSRLSAITGAANKPAVAKAEGIDIKDEQALNKRIQELKNARAAWNNWSTNPTLIKEIRDEMQGISPVEPELPAVDTAKPLASLRDAIAAAKTSIEEQIKDWSSRVYKANKAQIELTGDGPSRQGSMSISQINESKRRRAVEGLSAELNAVKKLEQQLADPEMVERLLRQARNAYADAERGVREGTARNKDVGLEFESILLDRLNIRPPRGSYTSNNISKAIRKVVESLPAEVQTEQAVPAKPLEGQAAKDAEQAGEDLLSAFSTALGKPSLAPSPPPKPVKLSKETEAKITELGKVLQRILGKFGLKNVALSIEQDLRVNGEYANRLIKLALDADSPVRDLRHESLHAMKELGFFSDAQWKTLEKFARDKWIDKYLKNRVTTYNGEQMSRYDAYMRLYNGSEDAVIEEAIADAFGDFDITKPPAGLMQTLLRRMRDLFRGIKESMGIANIDTAEDIFRRVEKGELREVTASGSKNITKASLRVMRGEERPDLGKSVTVDKVGKYFDEQIIKEFGGKLDYNNPEHFDRAVKQATEEVQYQIKNDKSGLDWYEEDIQKAFKDTAKVLPDLKSKENRILFSVMAGIMSPQTIARDNWFIAAKAFEHYINTGNIPGINPENGNLWMGGTQAPNKKVQLEFLDKMVKDLGQKNAIKWMMTPHTVKEINEFRSKYGNIKSGIDGKAADIKPGLYAFGPKIGPFVSNINGIHDVTVDKWFTRTFNRYFGTMIGPDGKIVDAPTEPQRRFIKELANKVAENAGIKNYQVQSLLWFYEQRLFTELGAQSPSYGFSDGAVKFLESRGKGGGAGVAVPAGPTGAGGVKPAPKKQPKYSLRDSLGLYSELENKIAQGPNKAAAPAWKAYINALPQKGVKPEEIEWSGVRDWLDLQTGPITKDAVNAYLKQGGVKVEEVVLGGREPWRERLDLLENRGFRNLNADEREELNNLRERFDEEGPTPEPEEAQARYGQYTLPGGENYREVLLTLPSKVDAKTQRLMDQERYLVLSPDEQAKVEAAKKKAGVQYRSSHWDQPNVLAHIRLNDRTDRDGNKVLFVEEIQSDWGQEGKKKGFRDDAANQKMFANESRIEDLDAQIRDINFQMRGLPDSQMDEFNALADKRQKLYDEQQRLGEEINLLRDKAAGEIVPAPFVTTRKFAVFKDDKEVTRTDAFGKEVKQRYDSLEAAEAAAKKVGGEARNLGMQANTEGWLNLALKRVMVMAADGGYDKVAFVNGEQSADRYDLSKQVRELLVDRIDDEEWSVRAFAKEGDEDRSIDRDITSLSELDDLVGKEVADRARIQIEKEGRARLRGLDLKVGGKGMKTFYDTIVPTAVKKLLPKVGGGQMRTIDLDVRKLPGVKLVEGMPVEAQGFDVTPDMQRKVETTGLPRFSLREDLGPRMNLRAQIDPAINARIDQTTFQRPEKGFIGRMMEAISPKNFSSFRASFLNRYNYLSEIDKEKVRLMGGKDLLADASAESAALLSDLGAGITASAMGVNDRRGGAPVYKRYFVVEVNNRSLAQQYTTRAAAQAAAARVNGVVRERGFTTVSTFNDTVKGPVAILAPLLSKYKDPHIFRTFQFYSGVKRGARFMYTTNTQGQVVEKLFDPADIQKAQQIEKQFPEFVQAHKEWIAYNDKLVDFLMDTGVLSKERADIYKMHGDYFPFYRQLDEDADALGPKVFQSIAAVRPPKKLKGGEERLGDFFENFVRNTQSAVQAGIKNIASRRAADVGMDVGIVRPLPQGIKTGGPTQFTVLEDGEIKHYESKDMLFINAIKSLNLPDMPGIGILAGPANLLRNLVTKDPGFILANLMRDSMSAWVTSGVKMTPIADTVANFGKSLFTNNKEFNALLDAGIIGGYEFSQNVETSAKKFGGAIRKAAGVPTLTQQIARPVTSVWDALERATTASDAATRMEIYKKTLAETGNEAEALFRSLEMMNFNRKGSSAVIRILTAAVPFLNARIQGLDLLYRAGINPMLDKSASDRAKEIQKTFFVRGAMIMGLSAAYWALTHDDEDYKKQEQETRDNYWLLPSLGIKIPIPFEIGVIFKVIPERILGYTMGTDTGKDFLDSMKRQLLNTLAFNPIPQAFIPIVETVTDFSFFTWRSILPQGMENVAPQYQVGPGTSKLAEGIGKAIGASPIKIDQLINGYTGTMGMYAVDLMDAIFSTMTDSPKPSKRFEQMPVIRRFAVDPEARGTVTAYYDLKNAVDQVVRTMNLLERSMDYEGYGEYMQENMKLLAARDYVLDMEKTLKELRESKNTVRVSTMDADAKRDSLTTIGQIENGLTSNIQDLKKIFR